ncbi:hypothetical protein ASD19_10840 [Microbacterium sp. Root53]|uniref:hypothetical protein n=1 Tax=Microbacterium sp. Root53 TaxID=1736553 RepID=UPI00071437B4|nr:hypothetical protein [Microbacterium sp. Root53]KQZ10041.1 hypothetical protein ASD19_10840 [Microbacterium sp. Root53]
MPAQGSTRSLQGRKAAAVRWGKPDVDAIDRDFAAAKLEEYISAVVAGAPPLTPAQVDRIVTILRPAIGGVAS